MLGEGWKDRGVRDRGRERGREREREEGERESERERGGECYGMAGEQFGYAG